MKKQIYQGLTALFVMASTIAYGQNSSNSNRQYDDRSNDSRSYRNDDDRNYRNNPSDRNYRTNDSYQNDNRRQYDDRNRDTESEQYRYDGRTFRRYDDRDLQQAYDQGYNDGQSDSQNTRQKTRRQHYQSFAFGVYGGLNSTRFPGEGVDGSNLSGRIGYQLGAYVRGGGRLYGQIGVEYLTSSSQFYKADTLKLSQDLKNVDQHYIHIPAYIGVKLAQSPRGMSAVRLQVGAELATITGNNTDLSFNNSTVNGLADLGFDAGPLTIDFVYHYGFNNTIKNQVASSKPRILGVNVGIKF